MKVGNREPQEGSNNAAMSRRTKCTFERCTFVTGSSSSLPSSLKSLTSQIRRSTINTNIFAIHKKNHARNSFRKAYKKYFPALIQNLATLVWFLCNIHATPRGAHGSYKKKSVPQRIPVKITKKNYKKIPGGELICERGNRALVIVF